MHLPRFFREAETAGRLTHPNIVTIYDAGEEHDLAYIAMEFLKGKDLVPHTKPDNLLPIAKTMSIIARVADALSYAHTQNVVHRDVKPANIMYEPQSDTVKVTDFGIARITDSSRTKTGMVLGTPSWDADNPVGCNGSTSNYPWRWGLSGELRPGEERTVLGYVLFRAPGAYTIQAGVVQEYVGYLAQGVSPTTIRRAIHLPDGPDRLVARDLSGGRKKKACWRISQADLDAWCKRSAGRPGAPAPPPTVRVSAGKASQFKF